MPLPLAVGPAKVPECLVLVIEGFGETMPRPSTQPSMRVVRLALVVVQLIPPCLSDHSSTTSIMTPALEECKLERERDFNPEGRNNYRTNVLMHLGM